MLVTPMHRMLGGALLVVALVSSQTAHADAKKMVLTRALKAGAATTYKSIIKANVQGMDIVIESSHKETIKTVKDNGTTVVVSEDLGGTMKMNGMETEQKAGASTTETRDKLGKLLELAREQDLNAPFSPEVQKVITGTSELLITDKEVAEGDSWDTTFDNAAFKDSKVKVKTTYQGTEKVGGIDLWKFKQTAEAQVNADGSKLVNESIIWINPKDGLMEKLEGKLKDVPSQIGPVDFSIAILRVKGDGVAPKPAK